MAAFNLWQGAPMPVSGNNLAVGAATMDAATDQVEWVFQAEEAATITRLGWMAVTLTGTQPVYQISLQGVDASGNPDGTIKAATNAKATFTPVSSNVWNWATLTSSYTCTAGEELAIVISHSSGTIDASNKTTFAFQINSSAFQQPWGLPYSITNNAGVRSRTQTEQPLFGYGSASLAYGKPFQTPYNTALSSNTTPDEQALRFMVPTTHCLTYKIRKAAFLLGTAAAAKSYKVILSNAAGTTLQEATLDSDMVSANGAVKRLEAVFKDVTLATLNAGTAYYASVQPQDTSNNIGLRGLQFAAAADNSAYPGNSEWYLATRVDAGSWTDDTTVRPVAEVFITDWTLPASSGGGPLIGGRLIGR